jgi:predicted transposase/invertase (TIGR01784 family)
MNEFFDTGNLPDSLAALSGPIPYPLTNDYMFHMVFQDAREVLKRLLAALLEIPLGNIISTKLLNPIIPGEKADDKEIILDLRIGLNNNSVIDIEMQVARNEDWINRSVFYLCRDFASFGKGKEYGALEPVIHISILDFNPPDIAGRQSLYTKYRLMDLKTHHVYSDIIAMNVLNLKYINKATEEERQTDLYRWASLFRARTWDDLKSAAKGVTSMDESTVNNFVFTMAKLSEDEKIRMACQAREDYELTMKTQFSGGYKKGIKAMERKIAKKDRKIAEQDKLIKELQAKIARSENQNRSSPI